MIEGVTYPSWTDLGANWARLAGAPVDGGGLYDMLSVGAHPQGFLATAGFFRTDDGGIAREVDVYELAKRVQLAVASFYISLTALANYHGYESGLITDLEGRIEAVFPNVWNTDPPALRSGLGRSHEQRSVPVWPVAVVVPAPAERCPEVVGVLTHREESVVRVSLDQQPGDLGTDALALLRIGNLDDWISRALAPSFGAPTCLLPRKSWSSSTRATSTPSSSTWT